MLSKSFHNRFSLSNKIANKFIVYVLAASLIVALAGSVISIKINYEKDIDQITDRLVAFEESHLPILSNTLKIGNRVQLQTELLSIISQPDVQYVKLSRLEKVSIAIEERNFSLKFQDKNTLITHQIPINHQVNGQQFELGELTLISSLNNVNQELYKKSTGIILGKFIEMLIVAFVILIVYSKVIGRHLSSVCSYTEELDLSNLEEVLTLNRKENSSNKDDELSHLANAINNMRRRLKAAYQKITTADIERDSLMNSLQEKNEELERFTYTVSHDLKSPLVTINGFIGLLEKDIKTNDTINIDKNISTIKTAAKTMHNLLNDLLELSRIGVQKSERVELTFNTITDEVLQLLAKQINSKQAIIEIEPNMPLVEVEQMRFGEVFLNLIENSLKYMEKQAKPLVSVGTRKTTNSEGKTEVIFYVKDNGRGIEESYFDQVFDLFERVAVDVEGTGVGLAIVKRIIETHNGRIWVESEGLGKGATFNFTIPVVDN